MYGKGREAEHNVGRAFDGNLPSGTRILTKVYCGSRTAEEIRVKVRDSLALNDPTQ